MTKLEADAYELAGAAAEHAWAKQGELDDDKLSDDIVKLAREFAAKVLRSIYEVCDNDQHSSDGSRARGAYWVKREYAGDERIEKRHYRKEFESLIATAIAAAEREE